MLMDAATPSPRPLDYNSRGVPAAQRVIAARTRWTLVLLGLSGLLCLAVFAFTPGTRFTVGTKASDGPDVEDIALLHQGVSAALPWLLIPGVVLPLAVGVYLVARRRIALGILLFFFVIVTSIAALFVSAFTRRLSPWTVYEQLTAADGTRYCFIGTVSWFHGQQMLIARERPSALLYSHYQVLGNTKYEQPPGLAVVRPTPPKTAPGGTLYQTDAGLLVGLRSGNCCYFVYDPKTQVFLADGDIFDLSPFLLLNASAQPYGPDIQSILAGSFGPTGSAPTRKSLLRDKTHVNPAVRQAAAQMLQAPALQPSTRGAQSQ